MRSFGGLHIITMQYSGWQQEAAAAGVAARDHECNFDCFIALQVLKNFDCSYEEKSLLSKTRIRDWSILMQNGPSFFFR